jgi:hypothetical protein
MTRCSFLLLNAAALHTGMMHTTFKEWLARPDEGFLLPDRPPLKGIPKINTTPMTDARRKRLHPKKVQPPKPFKPTVQMVKEIVPNKLIPKFKPL